MGQAPSRWTYVEEVETRNDLDCERAIQNIIDGELRDEERYADDRHDAWLEKRMKEIENYCLTDRTHRLTQNTFPGLLTMNEFNNLRIATLGRPKCGKSATVNRILELFKQKRSEDEYGHGEGDMNVRAVPFRTAAGHDHIIFVTARGSGEKYGGHEAECRVCDAIISNKLHPSDYCTEGNIRTRDYPMADQCHGVMFFVNAGTVESTPLPGQLSDRDFWEPLRESFNRKGIVPMTIVTFSRDAIRGCPLRSNLHDIMPLASERAGSAECYGFPIENVEPEEYPDIVKKRLRQELLLAFHGTIRQAELRLYRQELKQYRESQPDEKSKYTIAALLRHAAKRYDWPSSRLAELERKVANAWSERRLGVNDAKHITTDQFLNIVSDGHIFRSSPQAKQVHTVIGEFRGSW